jgi:hypothetical protein
VTGPQGPRGLLDSFDEVDRLPCTRNGREGSIDVTYDVEGEATITCVLPASGRASIDLVTGEVMAAAGAQGDHAFAETSGDWSLNRSFADAGNSAAVSASATLESEDGTHSYSASGTISLSGPSTAPAAGGHVAHHVDLTVSGGSVRWSVNQSIVPAPASTSLGGCYVEGSPATVKSGVLDPGEYTLDFICAAVLGAGMSTYDGVLSFTLTIEPA